tara:strand:+ start:1019 stop:1147 length:129 start_codon:yes stop_codon:yes gene_type:complete
LLRVETQLGLSGHGAKLPVNLGGVPEQLDIDRKLKKIIDKTK